MDPKADLAKADLMMSQHDAKIERAADTVAACLSVGHIPQGMGKLTFWESVRKADIARRMALQGNADTQKSKIEAAKEKKRRRRAKRCVDVPPIVEPIREFTDGMNYCEILINENTPKTDDEGVPILGVIVGGSVFLRQENVDRFHAWSKECQK